MNASCENWWMFAPSRADLIKVVCLPGLIVKSALNSILFVIDLSSKLIRWARYLRFCLEVNASMLSVSSACISILSLFYDNPHVPFSVALMCMLS